MSCMSLVSIGQLDIESVPIILTCINLKVEEAKSTQQLLEVVKDENNAMIMNVLYETGGYRKPLELTTIEDKPMLVKELRDGVLFSCWAAVSQLKEGLKNLGVLDLIQKNQDLLKQFFCYEPPVLSAGIISTHDSACL